jgi:N-acylneuraminate cytidylyltransferase
MLSAFIPARAGSKRIPGKNIRPFFGHPLLAYAIQGALDAGIFNGGIYVSSDSPEVGRIAAHYGATCIERPAEYALDTSPDAEWIRHALEVTAGTWSRQRYAILRPTAPFRTGTTIKRAHAEWDGWSLMKAVEPVSQHPGKMWVVDGGDMRPLDGGDGHLCQTNTLRKLYVQNASLEFRFGLAMDTFQPFLTEGFEGFDINTPEDWILAEALVDRGMAVVPRIERGPYEAAV